MRLSELIYKQRLLKGWTQAELASRLGHSIAGVSRWETGERTPALSKIVRLAGVLDLPLGQLLQLKLEEVTAVGGEASHPPVDLKLLQASSPEPEADERE